MARPIPWHSPRRWSDRKPTRSGGGNQALIGQAANYGGTRFTTYETPNTSVPDQFHTCSARTYRYAPCITTGSGSTIGHYARSLHPGGAQVALCDGSVRFAANTVNLAVWRGLGSRGNGEVAGEW
ncbi:MAG: H-X9-DG-CTERM domain-containing protein [Pirellulaceae bacterium]